jgi:hypothetical protein
MNPGWYPYGATANFVKSTIGVTNLESAISYSRANGYSAFAFNENPTTSTDSNLNDTNSKILFFKEADINMSTFFTSGTAVPGFKVYATRDSKLKSPEPVVAVNGDNIVRGSNGWSLVKGIPVAVRINQNGDLECAATNGIDCLWRGSEDEVLADINNPSFNASAPLSCGQDHKSKWGGSGYNDGNHWCLKAMSQLNPASPRINPMPASFVRYTRNYGNYLQY